jgi:hypothetical protein
VDLAGNVWHEVRLVFRGEQVNVSLDGTRRIKMLNRARS